MHYSILLEKRRDYSVTGAGKSALLWGKKNQVIALPHNVQENKMQMD